MKKTVQNIILVVIGAVVIVMALWVNSAKGGYDYNAPPIGAQDIIDALLPVPEMTARKYDRYERTRLIYNILLLSDAVRKLDGRVTMLEAQVKVLENMGKDTAGRIDERLKEIDMILANYPATDPNEVAK